jgi:hypothetical protein
MAKNRTSLRRKPLPRLVNIVRRNEDGVEFLVADEDIEDFADGEVVGEYELKTTAVKKIHHTITAP